MKISFILSSLWLSGGVRDIVEYANDLVGRGHQVAIVYPGGTYDDGIAPEIDDRIDLIASRTQRSHDRNPLRLLALIVSLARATPKSDVIVSTHTPTTIVTLLAAHLLRKGKAVWFYQDYKEMFDGRPLMQWLLQHALRWHCVAVTLSRYSIDELARYAPGKITYGGAGLSHRQIFKPLAAVQPAAPPPYHILYLGDMRPRKGLYDLLDAAKIVQQRVPQIELWIVSKEPCDIETDVPFRYIFRPTRSELAELYNRCHLFVSSSWWESFGLPPLEALASGAPVVVTNSMGVTDYARDGENSLVVPAKDPPRLAAAIERLLLDRELAARLAAAGPATAANFTWESAVDRFEKALDDCVHGKRADAADQ